MQKRAEPKAQGDYGAYQELQKLPKNASPVRLHNRCSITVQRVIFAFRDLSYPAQRNGLSGSYPWMKKASW